MDEIKITIIGAGVIGLAIASELSKNHEDIFVLEKNDSFGQETSSRNSEVIHAGIYYPFDSLKYRLCREGIHYLYDTCTREAIPHKRLGKVIIATEYSELGPLESLYQQAKSNGLTELQLLDKEEIERLEPHTNAIAGIYSPLTGILDTHSLMRYFYASARSKGVEFVYGSEVGLIQRVNDGYIVGLRDDEYRFRSHMVINAAGLFSDQVASLVGINIDESGYRLHLCKGDYFSYSKPSPVSMLVYPLPDQYCIGLGVHATLDMGMRLRFGPDHAYVQKLDYSVADDKRERFYSAATKIIPGLERDALAPDMAGIRPKIQGTGDPFKDFVIKEESEKGLDGLIDLIGIESPGLTSCISIAKMVARIVEEGESQ